MKSLRDGIEGMNLITTEAFSNLANLLLGGGRRQIGLSYRGRGTLPRGRI